MTKSIEGVLQESLLQAAEDGGTTVNGLVTIRLEALKEIEAIIQGVIGEPLVDDITWSPTLKDPYGRRHIMDTTKTSVAKTNINHGSYETIKRQYRRLRQALYGKEAEL